MTTKQLECHSSPDGALTLEVVRSPDGTTAIGFAGFSWHTHPDLLAAVDGTSEGVALRTFVDQVLADDVVIAVLEDDGRIREAWPTDDPESELQHVQPGKTLRFRLWSGQPWSKPDDPT
jgi:hypothetical protein